MGYQDAILALGERTRTWLVTGAAGFIGSALVEELCRRGQRVIGVDNFATGYRENLTDAVAAAGPGAGERFEFVEADICDAAAMNEVAAKADIVLHQAALGSVPRSMEDPAGTHRANVDGFVNVALACKDNGVDRLVYASSSSVYGDHPKLPKTEAEIGTPLSPYAATKRIDEVYASVFAQSYGMEIVGLRYFNVFGRRQDPEGPYAAVIPRWIGALLDGERCTVFGDGEQSRDFCYVDNAVQANILAAITDGDFRGAVFNVGCGERITLRELYAHIRGHIAASRPSLAAVEPVFEPERPGDIRHSQASIEAIRHELGYRPALAVGDGLAETVAWFSARRSS